MRKEITTLECLPAQYIQEKELLKTKRRSKRAQIKQSFSCECGKIYLSFSALYLHAKNKHNIKLTTNPGDQACYIEKVEGFSRYKYSIEFERKKENMPKTELGLNFKQSQQVCHQDKKNLSGESDSKQEWGQFFQKYLQKLNIYDEKMVVESFVSFAIALEKDSEKGSQKGLRQQIHASPYHLNKFLLEFLPKQGYQVNSLKWLEVCKILERLCKWMNQQKLTDLIVINQTK